MTRCHICKDGVNYTIEQLISFYDELLTTLEAGAGIGGITQGGTSGSTITVILDKYYKSTNTYRALAFGSIPGGRCIAFLTQSGQWVACSELASTRVRSTLIRKRRASFKRKGLFSQKEVLDIMGVLTDFSFKVGESTLKVASDQQYYDVSHSQILSHDDLTEVPDEEENSSTLTEGTDYLCSYSDSCYLSNNLYYSFIEDDDSLLATKVRKQVDSSTEFKITNATPSRLYLFISNKETHPNENLSRFFNQPIASLKRDLEKYNSNFYYCWRLMEVGDGDNLVYAYGWVSIDGYLIPVGINYELDPGCKLTLSYIFHSENDYDGHMALDIGCLDRARQNDSGSTSFKILFPLPADGTSSNYVGYGDIDDWATRVNQSIEKSV